MRANHLRMLGFLGLLLAVACADHRNAASVSRGSAGATAAGARELDNPGANGGTAGVPGLIVVAAGSSASPPAASSGSSDSSEVCDGFDNDANGIVDDVDVEMDGVCDCLNIATVGAIGPWSDGGNVFKQWLDKRSPRPAVELADQVITDSLLAPYQVIVFLHVATLEVTGMTRKVAPHHTFNAEEVAAFERWVRRGGGALTTIGYAGDERREVENVNLLLAPFSLGYVTMNQELHQYIEDWTPHPVTEGIKRIFTDNGVPPLTATGLSLGRDSGGHVALQVSEADAGHIAVWGDDWITYDSEWQDIQDQQVERLWLNIFKWLSPGNVCQVPTPELL